jgi:hypothetical protein
MRYSRCCVCCLMLHNSLQLHTALALLRNPRVLCSCGTSFLYAMLACLCCCSLFLLKNNVALVTGGGGGIGRAVSLVLAK